MIPNVRPLVAVIARGVLPFPDPIRRLRVRRAARKFVVTDLWPADDEVTGNHVAQLALLRLLALQKDVRRSVRLRQREASALLARTALETCIVGLYCLYEPTAVARLKKGHLKAAGRLLAFLGGAGIVPQAVIAEALSMLGESGEAPSAKQMVEKIDEAIDVRLATDLYDRHYVGTSTFYAHASVSALLRHVRADSTLANRPANAWARRSPARLADACTGMLAAVLAHKSGQPSDLFVKYADAHHARALPPMVFVAGQTARSRPLRQWLQALRQVKEMGDYLHGPRRHDPVSVQRERVRAIFESVLTGSDASKAALAPVVTYLTEKLISEWAATNDAVPGDDQLANEQPQTDHQSPANAAAIAQP